MTNLPIIAFRNEIGIAVYENEDHYLITGGKYGDQRVNKDSDLDAHLIGYLENNGFYKSAAEYANR